MPLIHYIPDRYEEGFTELATITDIEFNKILLGLESSQLTSSLSSLANKISEAKGIDTVDIYEIFRSIGSLIPMIENEETIPEIVEDILFLSEGGELIKPKDKRKLSKRLTILLNNKLVYYASKASDLINNYGNIFIQGRIIGDIRPVFDLDIKKDPTAGIIVYNLNIHYQSNEEPYHKDFSICLDSEDLKTLKEIIHRAEQKETRLQSLMKKSGLTHISK